MNSRTDALFLEALQIPAGAERDAFLDEACHDDDGLRRQLGDMLDDDTAADAFFDGPDTEATPAGGLSICGEKPGDMIGRYQLRQIIGEGGFGTVWMAEQTEPVERQVALKIIRIGMDTREFIARFEQEQQALAMMDHPNIARVHDGGATPTGRPYFVMELVHGVPITKFCDEHKLPLAARLELFIEACRAIQHAHQKGIIHRDIKPSNVMVTMDGDKPVPKVIDFGIAKATQGSLTDKTLATRSEQFIGTPAEAIGLQEQALAIKRRVLPPNHQYLANALWHMAELYEKDGRKDEALKLRGELEALRRGRFPAIHSTIVPPISNWKWLHPTDGKDPGEKAPDFHSSFFLPDFDDSAWKTDKDSDRPTGGFGYGNKFTGLDIVMPENGAHRHTAYFRHAFATDKEHTNLELRCQRDDGIIVYLDGEIVGRDNMPPDPDAYLLPAGNPIGPEHDGKVQRLPIPGTLAPGPHILAISVHNSPKPGSTDLRLGGVTLVAVEAPKK